MSAAAVMKRFVRAAVGSLGLAAIVSSNGCACANGREQEPEQDGFHETEWSIVVDVGEGGAATRIRLGPVTEVSAPTSGPSDTPTGVAVGVATPKSTIDTIDGSVITANDPNAPGLAGASAWALVYGAAAECGMIAVPPSSTGSAGSPVRFQKAMVPPWNNRSFYIFERAPISCDEVLAYEETLLCIGDRLAEIADAVAPVKWPTVGTVAPYGGLPAGAWTIPPQAEKDRFIARDLAINVLAHVSRVDSLILDPAVQFGSCSRLLAQAAASSSFAATNSLLVFGNSAYPPPALPITANRQLAESRLAFETHVLRGSARLLQDLVRRSVFADMAGAERRAGRVMDAHRGNQIAWGLADNQNGPYNSYAHAVRVLAGRWELGPNSLDPACGGVGATALLKDAYGADRPARDSDAPIVSAGQEYASKLVEQSGIVLPETKLAETGSEGVLREALRAQMLGAVAISRGLPPTDTAGLGEQKTVIDKMVDQAKDGDLHFAMARAARRYRLLTNTPETAPVATGVAGLAAGTFTAAPVTAAGGVVIDKSVSLARVAGDSIARVGGIFEATQCNETFGYASQLGTDNWLDAYPSSVQASNRFQRWTMQNVFDVGNALLRRLVVLREEAAAVGGFADDSLVDRLARSGMTEVRAWAGSARVFATSGLINGSPTDGIRVTILGANPADFAAKEPEDIPAHLSLVYGPPWVAECAARLRDACPPDFQANFVRRPFGSNVVTPPFKEGTTPFPLRRTFGHTDSIVFLDFSLAAGAGFDPKFVAKETKNEHLYLIADADPKAPDGRGMVLGAIALRKPAIALSTGFAISPMQRELFNAVLGLGKSDAPELSAPTSSKSPSYCIDGVPRDAFVPLENELTSDSDAFESSWKHYLTLAKTAAARADDLGQKLLDVGLQKEFRREAAGEILADVCGEPAALQKLTFTPDGKPSAPKDQENIKQCLGEDRWDLVFLGEDQIQLDVAAGSTRKAAIEKRLGCTTTGKGNAICMRLAAGEDASKVTTVGLRIAVTPKKEDTNACRSIVVGGQSLRSGLNDTTLLAAWGEPWSARDRFAAITQSLSMSVDTAGDWRVLYAGELIMDSKAHLPGEDGEELWPGCLRHPAGSLKCKFEPPAGGEFDRMASAFNRAFRRCTDVASRENRPLGQCETASGGADPVLAEVQALRYRVQSALWLAGAISGRVAPGMFRVQLPAVDFGLSDTEWGDTGARSVPELLTFYPPGRFVKPGPALEYRLDTPVTPDANELGTARPIHVAFNALADSASREVPAWLRDLYAHSHRYKHVETTNEEVRFDFFHANPFFDVKTGRPRTAGDHIELASLQDTFAAISGAKCSDLYGPLSDGSWTDSEVTNIVAAIKTNASVAQVGTENVVEFPFVGYSLLPFVRPGSINCADTFASGTFRPGYFDRKTPGLLFEQHPTISRAFDLPASGVLSSSGTKCPMYSGPESVFLTHPVATPSTGYPTASSLPPSRRARAFAGSTAPIDGCAAAHQLVQALTVTCFAGDNRATVPTKAIEVTDPSHIPALRRWVASVAKDSRARLGEFYIQGVPKRVVSEITKEGLGTSPKKGTKGEHIVASGNAIESVKSAWVDLSEHLDQIGVAIERASLEVNAADLDKAKELNLLLIARINAVARIVSAAAGVASITTTVRPGDVAVAAAQVSAAAAELVISGDIEAIAKKQADNRTALAMVTLRSETLARATQINKALTQIRLAAADIQSTSEKIDRLENKARYEAAKGSGADYYTTTAGEVVTLPVNVALRRQYAIAGIRYKQALDDAKYLAFMARRAIEQRIGVPLDTITTKVGSLEAPQSWADDVCSLQGLDYKKLTDKIGPTAGSDSAYVEELSKQYIGDYVAKLENFVEFYNIQFPSHEGDDTAVLSLKDDLLSPPGVCLADASNQLLYSGRLSALIGPTEIPPKGDGRWRLHGCDAAKCLEVLPGSMLPVAKEPPTDAARGGVTWLVETAAPSGGGDAGPPGDAGVETPGMPKGPPAMVSQQVHLAPGTYVLSWWDQARTFDGQTAGATPIAYRAGVFDTTFALVGGATPTPHVAMATAPWSPRHIVAVTIASEGDYYVSFAASTPGVATRASLAIANVQLERAAPGGLATPYVATDSSHKVVSGSCPVMPSSDLRAAFGRRCATTGVCWYELNTPLLIDTGLLKTPTAAVTTKLAKGNFNYRHISLSLNLVGTGVRSCEASPTPDCYGSGFVEYTLHHDAERAGILDWNGDVRFFKFGVADVQHAKALAAERFITVPIGSADLSLLTQPGIEKPELRGRPLDGSYRLVLWDSPALKWSRLEDIQVIMKYRYWSRVRRDGKSE